ncbi:uncharacterized protein MELLADRAFT_108347 [Melampsora larici-populina 98AG31]|uniref:Uncharacterized protein n=1 Tax=Melampsora larici-populina (strain 98AG31 / pathotype 3-4-7) TaxID=747676 RepID=F4RST8_MELLP|nr:uncharacterized protein MELLADRAFT_108347 [Melampsora larici-populina 98AG31]EGG04549.1 hypothetical protein MELLADRAFT_108347 [Melampsora larici-populina 98AG31]
MAGDDNPTAGGDSGTGKKRRIDDEEDEPVVIDSSDKENSESDEGLTFEETVARKKKKKAARTKRKQEEKRAALVGELAAGHETPSAGTGLSRALQEWLRFMMGISRKSKSTQDSDMPKSPTDEERKGWMDRKKNWEALITKAIDKAKEKYIARKTKKDPKFKPKATQILAIEKDAADEAMLTNPLKPVSFVSSLSFTELIKTPDGRKQLEEDKAIEKSKESRRRALTKIHTARMDLVNELFGEDSPEAKMVSYKEVHSKDEVTSSARSATRYKVRKECIRDREVKPRLIRRAKLITKRGTYSSTPDQESRPPKGFQRSLVSPTWLSGCTKLTVISLGLKNHNKVNISKALEDMVNLLQTEGSNIQSTQPVASGSGFASKSIHCEGLSWPDKLAQLALLIPAQQLTCLTHIRFSETTASLFTLVGLKTWHWPSFGLLVVPWKRDWNHMLCQCVELHCNDEAFEYDGEVHIGVLFHRTNYPNHLKKIENYQKEEVSPSFQSQQRLTPVAAMETDEPSRKRIRSPSPPDARSEFLASSSRTQRPTKAPRTTSRNDADEVVATIDTSGFNIPFKFLLDMRCVQVLFQIVSDFLDDRKSHWSCRKTLKFERKRMLQLMSSEKLSGLLKEIPQSIEKVIKMMKLDVKVIREVSCVVCFALHGPVNQNKTSTIGEVKTCNNLRVPSKTSAERRIICGAPLFKDPSRHHDPAPILSTCYPAPNVTTNPFEFSFPSTDSQTDTSDTSGSRTRYPRAVNTRAWNIIPSNSENTDPLEITSESSNTTASTVTAAPAFSRVMHEHDIKTLGVLLRQFREHVQASWPGVRSTPNMHYSQHLPDQCRRLGPPQYHAAWAGERIIGSLVQTPKSACSGNVGHTLIQRHGQRAMFRHLLTNMPKPDQLQLGLETLSISTESKWCPFSPTNNILHVIMNVLSKMGLLQPDGTLPALPTTHYWKHASKLCPATSERVWTHSKYLSPGQHESANVFYRDSSITKCITKDNLFGHCVVFETAPETFGISKATNIIVSLRTMAIVDMASTLEQLDI